MSFHIFHISEVFSNANGSVQYIVFHGEDDGQDQWGGRSMTMTAAGEPTKTFTFPSDLPNSATNGKSVLVATQGFANLGLVTPDFIMPAGFLFPGGGTLNFPVMDDLVFSSLPTNGVSAINENGETVASGNPTNFAGNSVTLGEGIPSGVFYEGNAEANTFTGGSGFDGFAGFAGNDTLNGGAGNDSVSGGDGADKLDGGSGNDTVSGGNQNDSISGGTGTDRVFGDAGNDTLTWGSGDFLNGGAGTDTFKFTGASLDLTTPANSNNRLTNFEQIDLRSGAHTLKVARADVLDMSSTNTIKILGDASDTVEIVGAQTASGSAPAGFTRYVAGSAILIIDSDIHVI